MEEDPVVGVADVSRVRADHHRVARPVVSHLLKTCSDLCKRSYSLLNIKRYYMYIGPYLKCWHRTLFDGNILDENKPEPVEVLEPAEQGPVVLHDGAVVSSGRSPRLHQLPAPETLGDPRTSVPDIISSSSCIPDIITDLYPSLEDVLNDLLASQLLSNGDTCPSSQVITILSSRFCMRRS